MCSFLAVIARSPMLTREIASEARVQARPRVDVESRRVKPNVCLRRHTGPDPVPARSVLLALALPSPLPGTEGEVANLPTHLLAPIRSSDLRTAASTSAIPMHSIRPLLFLPPRGRTCAQKDTYVSSHNLRTHKKYLIHIDVFTFFHLSKNFYSLS